MNLKRKLDLSETREGANVFVTDFGTIELSRPWLLRLQIAAEADGKSINWFDCRTNIYKTVRDYANEKAEREYLAGGI